MRRVVPVNPWDDVDFVALVDDLARSADRPDTLQAGLRARYPRAVVRARGLAAETIEVWYVYRDGSWTPRAVEHPDQRRPKRDPSA